MHPRFQTAFAQLADNLQSALEPILADKYFPALLTGEQVSSLKSATGLDEDALAFALLPLAAACARIKQWLSYLRKEYDEATELFQHVRVLNNSPDIARAIQAIDIEKL